jgi:Subtilisin inhibitor-like
MRIAIVIAALVAVVGCGAGSAAQNASPAPTDLRITVWPGGRAEGGARSYTLRCDPASGSLPRAATACSKLGTLPRPLAPVSRDAVCTEQYGGPQQALVTGRLRADSVWATFSATNGCQIARAKTIAFLLPGFNTNTNA